MDVPHVGAHKYELLPVCDLPVLRRRVPVADVPPRQVERDGLGLARLELDLVEAAEDTPGVILSAELDVLLRVVSI